MIRLTGIPLPKLILSLLAVGVCVATASGQPADPPPRLGLKVTDGQFVNGTPGVIVTQVIPGTAASRARSKATGRPQPIKPGDMVVGFAGEVVEADGTFDRRVAAATGRVELVIQSKADRQLRRLVVDLPPVGPPGDGGGRTQLSIGLTVRGCDSGIHVEAVEPDSPAATATDGKFDTPATIAAGSHLLSIDGQVVSTPAEAADRLAAAGAEIHFEIEAPKATSPGGDDPPIVLCVIGRIASAAAPPAPAP